MNLLIKNIADLKKYMLINADFNFEILLPYITKVQSGEASRIFGINFITELANRYNQSTPSPALTTQELTMIELLGNYIANIAFAQALPSLIVQVGGVGLFQKEGQNSKPVFQWQKLEYEDSRFESGFNALESAIEFLIVNRDHTQFSAWKNSTEEKTAVELFIRNAATFNQTFSINYSRRTFEALKPFVYEVEKFDIQSLIGKPLYNALKSQLKDFNISSDNQLLLPYIKDVVANAAIVKSIGRLNVKVTAEGMTVTSLMANGKETYKRRDTANGNDVQSLKSDAENATVNYRNELLGYLMDNLDKYPLFLESDTYKSITNTTALNTDDTPTFIL